MVFDHPGNEMAEALATTAEAYTRTPEAAASSEYLGTLTTASAAMGNLAREATNEKWPEVPNTAVEYLQNPNNCPPEHFSFAINKASEYGNKLENPALASLLLKKCVTEAENAALEAQEQQIDPEIAARTERINGKEAENTASQSQVEAVQAENAVLTNEEAQVNTTNKGLRKDIENIFIAEATPSE
jgi:hypothetical protein